MVELDKAVSYMPPVWSRQVDKVMVRGETDWVFVDRASRRPRSVPADIMRRFPILADDSGF